jgi:hypothetical protein
MEYDDLQQILKIIDSKQNQISESEICNGTESSFGDWDSIPENILINIYKYLDVKDIINCSEVSHRWNYISNDSLLWKYKFHLDFNVDRGIPRKPGKTSNFISHIMFQMSSNYIIESSKTMSISLTSIGLRLFDHMLFVFLFSFIRDVLCDTNKCCTQLYLTTFSYFICRIDSLEA